MDKNYYFECLMTDALPAVSYWASVSVEEKNADGWPTVVTLTDEEDGDQYRVSFATLEKGIRAASKADLPLWQDQYQKQAVRDLVSVCCGAKDVDADYDATTADVIVQFAIFGEVTYG